MSDARRAFLEELIDDAGLFPPASLSMEAATEQHAASREGRHGFMLGRFLCPASRLPELAKRLDLLERWRIGAIVDGPEGGEELARWLSAPPDGAPVEAVEARSWTDDLQPAAAQIASEGLLRFLEVPPDGDLDPVLDAIADAGAGAKLRCGGATADAFPAPPRVAAFIDGCRRRGIRLKATAGLHHPFRHTDPETGFVRHGFVNLAGAAVLAMGHDLEREVIEEIVAETDAVAFELTGERFAWRGVTAAADAVARARRDLFFAYGSCSFDEPVEDLLELGVLPLEP